MKAKFLAVLLIILFVSQINFAQKDSVKLYTWVPVAVVGLNLSQIALSNWTQGGDNSLAISFLGTGGLKYYTEVWKFKNDLKLAYGRTKLGSQDYRTTDNELYLESVLSRTFGWAVDPYVSNIVRTALGPGYKYDNDSAVAVAGFFDPGYLTQSIGFTYDKLESFTTRLGFAVQETFTNKYTQYADDPATPEIEKTKVETGLESVTTAELTLQQNLLYKSNLRLFTRFDHMDIWDVRWDNAFVAKINDYVNVNFSFLLIYQKDQSLKTQIKEALQLGLTYTLL
ncbi:MAG TPA: DUF3078 domain-containing protein [Ignavibacteriaceae bacterium]|nr:DUF3078 domain-containing protein [Ignavibacteriaceae bacterium]